MKAFYTVLTGLFLLCLSSTHVEANDLKSKIKGKWEVNVPGAPYGYQDYTVEIKEKNKALVADIKGNGVNLKEQALTEKDGTLTARIYIDEYITVTFRLEKELVKATADTSMGKLECNFKKLKIES